MAFTHFSKNGELRPLEEAVMPLSNIEYTYGFGVYETLRVVGDRPHFLADHAERLLASAEAIELEHPFSQSFVEDAVHALIKGCESPAFNIKILLVGAAKKEDAQLFMLPLNPLFPDKKLYRDGVSVITYEYERAFPQAKTLNMFRSFIAYREAKRAGAYDALLIDREGNIAEGTRTNFLALKGRTLSTPDPEKILLGVTRKVVLEAAEKAGFAVEVRSIMPSGLGEYDCAFLTGSSIGMLPIASVDGVAIGKTTSEYEQLSRAYDALVEGA